MELSLQSAFLAEMSTLLILLAGAVLLYSSFREKYLVPWIAGWSCLTLSKIALALNLSHTASRVWTSFGYAFFILAVGLVVTAVFLYVSQKKLLWSLLVLTGALCLGLTYTVGLTRPLFLYFGLALCWIVKIAASAQLIRFAWGRR